MLQIEGTEKEVSRFLKNLKISYKSDTVFVFIVAPGVAPRIEPLITPTTNLLRKQGIKHDIILFVVSTKKKAGKKYIKRMNFPVDYGIVIPEEFLKFFKFIAGSGKPPWIVPFLTKFSVSSGELISSFCLMNIIDSLRVNNFIKDVSRPKERKTLEELFEKKKEKESKIVFSKKIKLIENEEYPLSSYYLYVRISPSGRYLSITDRLSSFIYIFDLNTGKFVNVLYPDSSEERTFIKLPSEIFYSLRGIFRGVYLNHYFSSESTILITASLPEVKYDKKEIMNYLPAPVLIEKNIFSNKPLKITSFPYSETLPYFPYYLDHKEASFVLEKRLIFLPFGKGPIPAENITQELPELEKISFTKDPFRKEFYEKDIYQFGIFDFDGKFIRFLGRLSKYFEDLKIGYPILYGLVKFYYENYYTTDGFSGIIYKYDKDFNLLDSIKVFEINLSIPDIDYEKEPVKYILEAFDRNFYRRILDFFINNDTCYVFLKEREEPYLYKINLKNNKVKKYLLPTQLKKEKINYCFIDKREKDIILIALLDNPEETFYCEIKVK
ncbi:MAG: hypothetical protein NC926_11115 [Candidatus Omnitrophica bacterium]|nr:hypothetical protein [Candidatus Omnitrophota bacterium]